jgi:acetyl esterase/lipase
VDLEFETFLGIDWGSVKNTQELPEARVIQLQSRDKKLQKVHSKLIKTRQQSINYLDKKKKNREPLQKGDLVLVYNKSLDSQWGKLFENKWNGPYRVINQLPGGSYALEELDGVELTRKYAASHVQIFYKREEEEEK